MRTTLRPPRGDGCPATQPREITHTDTVRANQIAEEVRAIIGRVTIWTSLDMGFYSRHGIWYLEYKAHFALPGEEGFELTGDVAFDGQGVAEQMAEQIRSGVLTRIERDQGVIDVLREALEHSSAQV